MSPAPTSQPYLDHELGSQGYMQVILTNVSTDGDAAAVQCRLCRKGADGQQPYMGNTIETSSAARMPSLCSIPRHSAEAYVLAFPAGQLTIS